MVHCQAAGVIRGQMLVASGFSQENVQTGQAAAQQALQKLLVSVH
jgi:hypothetical protein